METNDEVLARAFERGAKMAATQHRAVSVSLDTRRGRLILELLSGAELSIPIASLGFPAHADLSGARLEGGGFDLYFPLLDDGAYIPDVIQAAMELPLAA